MSLVAGIDLGTTNSSMVVWMNGTTVAIKNENNKTSTPSCISFTEHGYLLGEGAMEHLIENPKYTIIDAKRLIGQKFKSTHVQNLISKYSFEVIECNKKPVYCVDDGHGYFYPVQISALILMQLKKDAEKQTGQNHFEVVITVPAYFNEQLRESTKIAAEMVGFTVLKLLSEPVAAALSYGQS